MQVLNVCTFKMTSFLVVKSVPLYVVVYVQSNGLITSFAIFNPSALEGYVTQLFLAGSFFFKSLPCALPLLGNSNLQGVGASVHALQGVESHEADAHTRLVLQGQLAVWEHHLGKVWEL